MKNRREFLRDAVAIPALAGVAGAAASCGGAAPAEDPPHWTPAGFRKPQRSAVAILKVSNYASDLSAVIRQGLAMSGLDVRGKSVLLKPNLVEQDSQGFINTNPAVVVAAVEALRSLGAREVAVGEGCGHQRDSEYVLASTGLLDQLRRLQVRYVDLNLDDVTPVSLRSYYMGIRSLYLPDSLRRYDMLFSLPKMKTHHWAGVTLSMKNLFGVVPGRVYGWPKNFLHQHDIGRSILDINSTVPVDFCIVDGIVAMEGNGPIQGDAKPMGVLVMGTDPVAVDATCCRLMGIDPQRIDYVRRAGAFLGNMDAAAIEQRGENVTGLATQFKLPPNFANGRFSI